jgi:hypothetical protein
MLGVTTDYTCESWTCPLSYSASPNSWFLIKNHQK